jgi:beta-lactamase regulating signal transducer with metallopeptidase domain
MVSADLGLLLIKWNLLLGTAWIVHFVIGRRNPMFTVRLWRVTIVCIVAISAASLLPPLWEIQPSVQGLSRSTNDLSQELSVVPGERITDLDSEQPSSEPSTSTSDLPFESLTFEAMLSESRSNLEPPSDLLIEPVGEQGVASSAMQPASETNRFPQQNRARSILLACVTIWGIGFCWLAASLVKQGMRSWECIRASRIVPLKDLQSIRPLPERLCGQLVSVRVSKTVSSPCVMGVIRPSVVIPEALLERTASPNEVLCLAIAHELIHLQRHDLVWHLIIQCIQTLLWPLPGVWRLAHSHLFACERVCDELCAEQIQDRARYRTVLAKLALQVINSPRQSLAISMTKRPEIFRRLDLLSRQAPRLALGVESWSTTWAFIALSCLVGLSGWTGHGRLLQAHDGLSVESQDNEPIKTESQTPGVGSQEAGYESTQEVPKEPLLNTSVAAPTIAFKSERPADLRPIPILKKAKQVSPPIVPDEPHVGIIRGHVTDAQGNPVANAKIEYARFTLGPGKTLGRINVSTNSNGDWSLDLATIPNVLGLKVTKLGFLESIIPSLNPQVIHQTTLQSAYAFHGTVLDAQGSPAQGVTVFGGSLPENMLTDGSIPSSVAKDKSDARGSWQISNSLNSEMTLYATRKPGELAIATSAGADDDHQLQLRAPKSVRFRVTNSNGDPISDATIRARGWFGSLASKKSLLTDAEGIAVFEGVPRVDFLCSIEKVGMRTKWLMLFETETDQQVTVYPTQVVDVRVVDDATGLPIGRFMARCNYDRPGWGTADSERWPDEFGNPTLKVMDGRECVVKGQDGQLKIVSNLDFHFLHIRIQADGYDSFNCSQFDKGEPLIQGTFRLKKSGQVQVIDVDGQPAANCMVAYHKSERNEESINTAPGVIPRFGTKTDSKGMVAIAEKDPENRDTIVAWSDRGCAIATRLDLIRQRKLNLVPWAKLTLLVPPDLDTSPLTISYFTRRSYSSPIQLHNEWVQRGPGEYVCDRIPAGTFCRTAVRIHPNINDQHVSIQSEILSDKGMTLVPFGKTRVTGQLEFFENEVSVGEIDTVRLSLFPENQYLGAYFAYGCECDQQGNFQLDNVQAGAYVAQINLTKGDVLLDPNPDLKFRVVVNETAQANNLELGKLPFILSKASPTRTWDFPIETTKTSDEFHSETRIKFITENIHSFGGNRVVFWTSTGRELRSIANMDGRWFVGTNDIVVSNASSEIHVSSMNDVRTYDLDGNEVRRASWQGNRSVGIAGQSSSGVCLYSETKRDSGQVMLRRLSPDASPQTMFQVARHFCQYSHHDHAYWSFAWADRIHRLQCVQDDGTKIHVSPIPESIKPMFLCVDEAEGGCWCLSKRSELVEEFYLTRYSKDGSLLLTKELHLDLGLTFAVVGGKAYIRIGDQLIAFDGTGSVTSTLPIDAKSLAGSADHRTLWVLTDSGVTEVDVSGPQMVVRDTINGVRGHRLWVVN